MAQVSVAVRHTGIAILTAVALTISACHRGGNNKVNSKVHVTLIGASIGQAWNLARWPDRANVPEYTADSIAAWQFDKSEAVEEVLLRPKRKFRPTRTYVQSLFQPRPVKPDIVILKECSSYFPGDVGSYRASIRGWVQQLQEHNVQVVLATVVPVTRLRAAAVQGKQETLVAYNHWLREYAQEQRLPLLDLEAALREAADGSYLREDYAASDGSHLNANAYHVLDNTLRTTLCAIRPTIGCQASTLVSNPAPPLFTSVDH